MIRGNSVVMLEVRVLRSSVPLPAERFLICEIGIGADKLKRRAHVLGTGEEWRLLGEGEEARLAAELAGFFVHDSIHGRYKKNSAKCYTRRLSSLIGLTVAPGFVQSLSLL